MPVADPLVSVLVPAFNHRTFVASALESIAAETYSQIEIIVRDDGSTDGTPDIVDRWIQARPTLNARLERQEHRGLATTLNRLLAEASGRYVTALASDDELIPGGIATRLAALDGDTRAVFGDATIIDANGDTTSSSALRTAGADIGRLRRDVAAEIISRWRVPGPVLLSETAALREIGGWSTDLVVEDWDLYLRLAARGWLRYVDKTVARYRLHETNVVRDLNLRTRILADHRRVAQRNAQLFGLRNRLALSLQRAIYTPWAYNTRYGTLRDIPARTVSRFLNSVAVILAHS